MTITNSTNGKIINARIKSIPRFTYRSYIFKI